MSGERLRVQLQLGDLKAEAEGSVEEVLRFVSSFIGQHLPAYGLARRLATGPDLINIMDALQMFIGHSEGEGLYIKPAARDLPIPQQILLYLAKRKLENLMALSQKGSVDVSELAEALGLNNKTLTARLTELVRGGLAQRVERGEYQATMAGIEELLNRLKTTAREK
ncbi:MAG: hypothetical protein QW059_01070 [Nitrososphaerota archaeon]